ncbi:MAG: lysylphosphatidylglycerol synthase domain-containing protein [Spirochaetia bacterium]
MNRKTRKIIIILVELAVIIALFVYFGFIIAKDYDKFADTISRITIPFFCGLILIQFAKHGVGSLEWLVLLRQAGSRKSFFTLFTARLTGFAISYLTPSLYLGGEPARAAVLNDSTISYKKALFLFLLIKLFRDKAFIHNFFRIILRPVLKFRPRFAVKVMLVVKEFQSDISTIIKEKKAFYLASGIGFLISLIEVFQSYYIISFLYPTGYSPSMILIFAFIIYFSSLIFSLIPYPTPGGLGPVEGIYVIFFILFGMQRADGLLYSLLLRMGQSVSIGLGLVNLFLRRVFKKRDKTV